MRAGAPGRNPFVTCAVEVNGAPGSRYGFSLAGDVNQHVPLRGWVAAVLGRRSPPEDLTERTETVLTHDEARAIHSWCEQRIDELLPTCRHDRDRHMGFSVPATYSWRGVEHTIQRMFDPVGEELSQAAFPFLTLEEVESTVSKLERRGFVLREGAVVRLLPKGGLVDIAGP